MILPNDLAQKSCRSCLTASGPLPLSESSRMIASLRGWHIVDGHHLQKIIQTHDFATGQIYANAITEIAENENHHPELRLSWGEFIINIWTHKVDGLTEADFVLAAKIDLKLNDLRKEQSNSPERIGLRNLQPFPDAVTDRYGFIRLDLNERNNMLAALDLTGISPIHVICYPQYDRLLQCLCQMWSVTAEQLMLSSGSDEALLAVANTFIERHADAALICDPTFRVIRTALLIAGARLTEVPVLFEENRFFFDERTIERELKKTKPKLAILASPDNPTGAVLPDGCVEKWTERYPNTVFVIDEAYFEYTQQTVMPLIARRKNLLVLRTFSKAWGMAGLRVGVTVGPPHLIHMIKKGRLPYPISSLSAELVASACDLKAVVEQDAIDALKEKERICRQLEEKGFTVIRGKANFYLLQVGRDALALTEHLRRNNILVRNLSSAETSPDNALWGCLRVAVGSSEQNHTLLNALESFKT